MDFGERILHSFKETRKLKSKKEILATRIAKANSAMIDSKVGGVSRGLQS
jgi:hypothetical protein